MKGDNGNDEKANGQETPRSALRARRRRGGSIGAGGRLRFGRFGRFEFGPFRHVHLPGLAGKVTFAQFLHDGSEIATEVIDPAQQAQNTTMAALGTDVLTLNLPVRQPEVDVPVVELFLTPGQ